MPDGNMLHGDTSSGDAGFTAKYAWPGFDALIECFRGHVDDEVVTYSLASDTSEAKSSCTAPHSGGVPAQQATPCFRQVMETPGLVTWLCRVT